ncbi:RecX family transcriptional regulator [Candidatus Saccharibacteria bacterium]|nr:RecX family transcriptional regulator [Candidatus Saccharibacteria bacterium]
MRVTSIKQQVKNPERISIFVDEKYSFSLSLDELLAQKIKKDQELSQADIRRLKKISADGKLRARALEWLLNRPHSIREFKDYLYRKKAEPELTKALIKDFTKRGYLDELKFSQWLVELQKRRGKSNRAIRAELLKKGITREIADEFIGSEENDEAARLKVVIEKKQKLSRYKNDPQKLMQYLVAQGFSWQLIKDQLAKNDLET